MELLGFDLALRGTVYEPREDSLLLAKTIAKKIPAGRVLDMGTGSGLLALVASSSAAKVVAADINPTAVECARENAVNNGAANVEVVESDLFERVTGTFDVILFNAPYLPAEDEGPEAKAWSGGPTGRRVIEKFLKQAGTHLAPKGKIYLLISSLTGLEEVCALAKTHGFAARKIAEEKVPWETLYVLEIKRTTTQYSVPLSF